MLGNLPKQFEEYLEIERQRNLQMIEISRLLRVDFTFSEEELVANAEAQIAKYVEREIQKEMDKIWMKLA